MNALLVPLVPLIVSRYPGGHPGPHHGGGGWWWIAWPLGWLVVVALLGVLTWLIVRSVRRGGPSTEYAAPSTSAAARGILAERFARGEIDEQEYRDRLDRLE